MFTAIVLAGDRAAADPHACLLPGRKALLPLAGKPMLAHVLGALAEANGVAAVFIAANRVKEIEAGLQAAGVPLGRVHFSEGAASPVQSVLEVAKRERIPFPLLVLTADSPLLTAPEIDAFCLKALAAKADAAVAVGEKSRLAKIFPNAARTWIPLRGDAYHGCNLFALLTPKAMTAVRFWRSVEGRRKSALRLAAKLGFKLFLGVLFRAVSLEGAFRVFSQSLKVKVVPVSPGDIRIAIDVDKPADAALAEQILLEAAR
ncbi:MAG TPA: nucleotidyltransferase family protein [Sphingomonadales bacterium]|nr:nucleotidyltransferase family protein [Sphingomonadales bacterium]